MKFENIVTGAILETNNKLAIEQMRKSENYREYKKVEVKAEPKKELKVEEPKK